jgi:hypothetical protein
MGTSLELPDMFQCNRILYSTLKFSRQFGFVGMLVGQEHLCCMSHCALRQCQGLSYEGHMQVCENSGGVTSHSMWKFTDVAVGPATLIYGAG